MKKLLFISVCFILLLNSSPTIGNDLRSKIGQMLIVGFDQYSNFRDTLMADITQRNLGGVILFGSNILNPLQVKNLTNQLQQTAETPLFIATDQEGGYVARLKASNGFENTYSAYRLGTIFNSEDSTRATAAQMAQWLLNSGINVNLAPVVDVNVNPLSPAIGYRERSFSSDPTLVFNHAFWFIDEFKQKNIILTLKHFPGHGSAVNDSHLGFTDITTTWADSELVPYQQLFETGYADMVMIGHLYNSHLDSIYPASLSYKVVTTLLKDRLKFEGVIISDEMLMMAITDNYSFEDAIVLAINAGTDILLFRSNEINNHSLVRQVIDIVEQKVLSGEIAESRIEESCQRIMSLKKSMTFVREHIVSEAVPDQFVLTNYPNPFNSSTDVMLHIQNTKTKGDLKIYNILGQVVWEHHVKFFASGRHRITFYGSDLPSGIYFLRFETKASCLSRKITLIK